MSGQRKRTPQAGRGSQPVGLGYLPKGGRAAGAAHNGRVLPPAPAAAEAAQPVPVTHEDRPDVHAKRVRPGWTWADRVEVATIAVVAAAGYTGLWELVSR